MMTVEEINRHEWYKHNRTVLEIIICIFAPVEDGGMSRSDMIDCFDSDDLDEICARPYEEIESAYLEWKWKKKE